ncbi:MICAL-like protein 2a [Menidia menidia]
MAAIKALELWCKVQCDGYRDVAVTNMTTSFRNGMAFCALIHKYRPDLIDYDSLRKEDVFENNRLAFQIAEEKLGIPALLDAEDMVALRIPDRLSILTYVSQYYNYFKGRTPVGGVKRPAEGSKEEPSEKKNLPVVAKSFVPKTGVENRLPATLSSRTSPKLARVAAQAMVLTDSANKSGTLNSKCFSCKSHVHLVQRQFVEGKLYHRSCFKCSECSSVLHAGSYRAGKTPDTFVCNIHPSTSETSSTDAEIKNRLASPPRPPSVLCAPLTVVKPASAEPPSQAWTASAQRTQVARQRFFQAAPQVAQTPTGTGKPAVSLDKPKLPQSPDEKSGARPVVEKKLAEENSNNNNKRPFTIRSSERRFYDEPRAVDFPGLRKVQSGQSPAGTRAGQSASGQTNTTGTPCLKTVNKDDTRPAHAFRSAKDAPGYLEWQTKLKSLTAVKGLKDAEPETLTEQCASEFMSITPCNVSISTTSPPSAPTTTVPVVSVAPLYPVNPLIQPPSGSESLGFKHSRSPVKSPPRPPAVHSLSSSLTGSATPSNHSAAKKGKYLSPINAFRTEMRSPSAKSSHIPVEQIEKELNDIETNLAQLEKEGVELEKKLRSCEEVGDGDILMDPLMVDWFNLIHKKQMFIRKESEIVYIAKTQELEQQQPGVEEELRRLMEKPDNLKSREERQREKKLMKRLMEIVDGRNAIVEGLDEDRLREVEEDQQLNKMMKNLGVKKPKIKRKSSISKLFRRRSKRRVE